jgi:hypothetical protein
VAFDASPSETVTEIIPGLKPEYQGLSPKQRLVVLRDTIKQIPDNDFCMSNWVSTHTCGTVACIGGWGQVIFFEKDFDMTSTEYGDQRSDPVGEALGLSYDQREHLFYMNWGETDEITTNRDYWEVDKSLAIAHLDQIILTGEVSWDKVFEAAGR